MKISAIESYDPELVAMVKKYMQMKFTDESMIRAIKNQTGNVMSEKDLTKWKKIALREKKEANIEIDEYMKNMITLGMFEDVKDQYERSKDLLNMTHMMAHKAYEEDDTNKYVILVNTSIRQTDEQRKIATSMGNLVKIKEYIEKGFNNGPIDENSNGTSISVETKPKGSFDDAVAESISELDLKENEVF